MNLYDDLAALYDIEHGDARDDIEFYLNVVNEGPVLELGAGTGRVMEPLLQAGHEVWGVDSSQAMLDRARQRLAQYPQARLIKADVSDLAERTAFRYCILSLNFLWHFHSVDAQLAALQVAYRHLHDGGLAIVDLTNPLTMADRHSDGELRQRYRTNHEDSDLLVFSAAWDNEVEQQLTLSLTYDETDIVGSLRRKSAELRFRYLYRSELLLLLRLAGFTVLHVYGSYDLDPYSGSSPNLITIAQRRQSWFLRLTHEPPPVRLFARGPSLQALLVLACTPSRLARSV